MRFSLCLLLAVALSLAPGVPLVADPPLPDPFGSGNSGGDMVAPDQFENGQSQQNQQLQRQQMLLGASSLLPNLSFTVRPTYSTQIPRGGDFTASVQISNTTSRDRRVSLLVAFTPPGTTATRERYLQGIVRPGGSTLNLAIRNQELLDSNITPGRYSVTFLAFDDRDQRIETGFFGNPFTFGNIAVSLPTRPAIPTTVDRAADLKADFTFTNDGDTADRVSALLVFTPPGQTRGIEFYANNLLASPGRSSYSVVLTPAQRSMLGITPGQWLITATGFNGAGARLQSYSGNLLTLGTIDVTLPTRPVIPVQVGRPEDLVVDFLFNNGGNVEGRVTPLLVFTRPGQPGGIEVYSNVLLVPAGSAAAQRITLTPAQRDALGITAGQWLITATGFDGAGNRLQSYSGNLLTIGTLNVTLPSAPVIPSQIGQSEGLIVDFTFQNTGDTEDPHVSALLVFTRPGQTRGIEFYAPNLAVPPGARTHRVTLTEAQRTALGIAPGHWLVTATAFNEEGTRLLSSSGNLLTIGTLNATLPTAPILPKQIGQAQNLEVDFPFANGGDTADRVSALLVFTRPGESQGIEFYATGLPVDPGGTTQRVILTAARRQGLGIPPGRWLVTATGFDGAGNRLQSYPGNLLTLGEINVTLPTAPVIPQQIGRTADLKTDFTFVNTGDTGDRVSALLVFTRPGQTDGIEFYATNLAVNPGSATHPLTLTSALLAARGVTPGRWLVTATGFDGAEKRLASYPGSLLTIGAVNVTLDFVSAIPSQIAQTDDLGVDLRFGNSGDTADRVSALLVFTRPGETSGIEFYATNLPVHPGGATQRVILTSAQRAALGITPGRWLVTATGFDGAEKRLSSFAGNPLTIGNINVTLPTAPVIPQQIARTADLNVDFIFNNTGNAQDRVTALLVFTRPGEKTGIEFYAANLAAVQGSSTHRVVLTAAQRAALGIPPGRWLVTATGFDGADRRLASYPGSSLTIGTIQLALPTVPVIPQQIARTADLPVDFTFVNTGDTPDRVTALLVLTRPGEKGEIEFYATGLPVDPGSATRRVTLTSAQLAARGVTPGRWLVTATGFDGADRRLQSHPGNPLAIGEINPTFTDRPTFTNRIHPGEDFVSTFRIGNTGDTADKIILLVALTPQGSTRSVEATQLVAVPPRGGLFEFRLTAGRLALLNILPGFYTVTFLAFDGKGDRIADGFFGALFEFLFG